MSRFTDLETTQVPDELLTLLNDPYIFSNAGEITTKEILKRFQDRRGQISLTEVSEVYNRQDTSSRSPPKRVETDPSLWQGERTVRPVQDPPMHPTSNSGLGTPPQRWAHPGDHRQNPYDSRFNHSDSQLDSSDGQKGEWRNSAWGRRGGGLGVGGNS